MIHTALTALASGALLACDAPRPEVPAAPEAPATSAPPHGAVTQAARTAPVVGIDWEGPWAVSVLASDVTSPGAVALAAGLGGRPEAWSGALPVSPQGHVTLLWLDAGQALPQFQRRPPTAPEGQVVAVLGPGDADWVNRAADGLPWQGLGVIDPVASAGLWADPARASDPAVAGTVAAAVVARTFDVAYTPPAQVPAALAWVLLPPTAADTSSPDVRLRAAACARHAERVCVSDPQVAVRLASAAAADTAGLALLAEDAEPLVRARAMDRLDETERLARHVEQDGSSLVRLVAAHRLATATPGEGLDRAAASPDAYVRWKAAYGLGRTGNGEAVLLGLLPDVDPDVRREAARALGRSHATGAVDALVERLARDENSFVRRWAAEALGLIGDPRAVEPLRTAADDPTTLVAEAAARALGQLGVQVKTPRYQPPWPPRTAEDARLMAASPDVTARKDLCKHLAGRADMLPLLLQLAEDVDSEVRKSAVEALGWTPGSVDTLSHHLDDPDPDTLVTTLDALARLKAADARVLPLLQHPDAEIRLRATEALAATARASDTLPAGLGEPLLAQLDDPDERVRAAVARAYPAGASPRDASVLVRRAAAARDPERFAGDPDSLVLAALPGADPDLAHWALGVIAGEDDLLHLRFSWTAPDDRPPVYRSPRPPVIREYGHPNRG